MRLAYGAPNRIFRQSCLTVGLIFALSGCALMHKDSGPVEAIAPDSLQLSRSIHLANSGWPSATWWQAYRSPQLDGLIAQAFNGSPTLQAARMRIAQSQSTVELAQSVLGVQATGLPRKTGYG